MRKSKILLVMVIAIGIVIWSLYFMLNRPIYGNEKEGIINSISQDGNFKDKKQIEIFNITDIATNRLVGYYYNDLTCIANFVENESGNYKLSGKQWAHTPIQTWLSQFSGEGLEYRKIVFAYNGKSNLGKIKVILDDNYAIIEKTVISNKADIIVIDLEDSLKNKDNYAYSVEYYDTSGNKLGW